MSYLAYEIIQESFTITREGPSAEVTVLCPVDEAAAFAKQSVGGYQNFGGRTQYFTPTLYATDAFIAYCNKAVVEHVEPSNPSGYVARVKLSFGKLDQPEEEEDEGGDPTQIADFTYDLTAQEMTLPKKGLQFDGAGPTPESVDEEEMVHPIKMVAEGSLSASFKFKPQQSPAQWIPYVGKVNAAEFRGHPAESVLFTGVSTKRTRTTDGHDAWEYSVNFLAKYGHTWNQIYRAELAPNGWRDLIPPQYETADFDDLIENL